MDAVHLKVKRTIEEIRQLTTDFFIMYYITLIPSILSSLSITTLLLSDG